MILQPPELPSELEFAALVRGRLVESIDKMPEDSRATITGLYFLLYDCVGNGIPAFYGEWQINTLANIEHNQKASSRAAARWDQYYFLRDDTWSPVFGNMFSGDKDLLLRVEADYAAHGVSEDERGARFWGLFSWLLKEFKSSFPLKERLPHCEMIFIDNSVGYGYEFTELICDGVFPEDFWQGAG
ncbi:MAG: hypothetical protein K9N47_26315 [Prosthecobacter sp.]|uniref:hypothetical protein n=1 Tax=Prosthecobacter sp. TaxID=1965333 RepID=UPI002606E91B|nr:hypothetical protein [Prosthecobacter sp.]MCF7789666.1 hypothetical protein [Prosthecobacter sp.]